MNLEELKRDLKTCQSMIGSMCAEGRPPKMSIPARPNHDEDIIISTTINRAIAKLEAAQRSITLLTQSRDRCIAENTRLAKRVAELDPANCHPMRLNAAFDKEQQ